MFIFVVWLLSCLAIGAIASRLDRSFFNWFSISFFLSPIIGLLVLIIKGNAGKTCPECSEKVKEAASKCKHCGHIFRDISDAKARSELLDKILEKESNEDRSSNR